MNDDDLGTTMVAAFLVGVTMMSLVFALFFWGTASDEAEWKARCEARGMVSFYTGYRSMCVYPEQVMQ